MKHIVIFGGTGERGRPLCRQLLTEGNQVTCMDDESTGWVCLIADCLDNDNFKFIRSKIEHFEMGDFKEKIDLIYDYTPTTANPVGKEKIRKLATQNGCKIIKKTEQNIRE